MSDPGDFWHRDGTLFVNLIIMYQPETATVWQFAQLLSTDPLVREWLGMDGTIHGIQKWHVEYTFIRAGATISVMACSVLSPVWHIHGFGSDLEMEKYYADSRYHEPHPLRPGKTANVMIRLRQFHQRHVASFTFGWYAVHVLWWTLAYGIFVWTPAANSHFWQANCPSVSPTLTKISRSNLAALQGQSWVDDETGPLLMATSLVFLSLGFVFVTLMMWPVFWKMSAAELLARLLHVEPKDPRFSRLGTMGTIRERMKDGKTMAKQGILAPPQNFTKKSGKHKVVFAGEGAGRKAATTPKAERFVLAWTILFKAAGSFLVNGYQWTYATIQNVMLGTAPFSKFLFGPVREFFRKRHRRRKAEAAARKKAEPEGRLAE
ncbi:hypothetical protein MNV49_005650 [Pseudohyphozyma bogoriensis]|nr:hypothetical protein MNV49_005650 [Pseudohyphozyma bogoriensis]